MNTEGTQPRGWAVVEELNLTINKNNWTAKYNNDLYLGDLNIINTDDFTPKTAA